MSEGCLIWIIWYYFYIIRQSLKGITLNKKHFLSKHFNDKAELIMAFTVEMLMVCVLLKSINFCYLIEFMLTTYLLLLFQLTKKSTTNIKLVFPVSQNYPNFGMKLQKTLRFQFKMSEEREWGVRKCCRVIMYFA